MEYRDYYKILGIAPDAEPGEIKRAFRKLARKYHPDINASPEAEAMFKDVNEAYEVLKDPERRAAYDQLVKPAPGSHDGFRPPPGWEGGFDFTGGGPEGAEAFSDFFESLFRRRGQPFGGSGADQHARLQLDIEDAYRGATRVLTLRVPQTSADGSVHLQDRSITVHVPKGILEGQHIRLPGQGMAPLGGGGPGDLFLEVSFAPHPVYRADGRDLYLDLPVAPWEAALGGRVMMPTPGGKVALTVPANARSGQKLRLKGKGLPGTPPGDIYATLRIVNPKVTTEEARRVFEQMAREVPFNPRAGIGG
ncbi:DnaJ domain-containing protein (plasmid) [Leisingera aquaemixtae]|uniref:DnaJ C-terminal domain-containing protein n=1 Tax=Leisingera aquaemixtae TaxID=1396826 RepID=UPI0021A6BD96|nr:DnaJ C-terminal domain-containing protein [Leisingera aquaemixtae]UWQ27180.1 DnaJ domain-containing protein [Leisingera aquaemixtae]